MARRGIALDPPTARPSEVRTAGVRRLYRFPWETPFYRCSMIAVRISMRLSVWIRRGAGLGDRQRGVLSPTGEGIRNPGGRDLCGERLGRRSIDARRYRRRSDTTAVCEESCLPPKLQNIRQDRPTFR